MKKVEGIVDIRDMLKPYTDEEKIKHKVQQLELFKEIKPQYTSRNRDETNKLIDRDVRAFYPSIKKGGK
tara:strand:- start:499 stop:705 length:207 start_codon:yes stop_codon:yes gene_type:complete